MQFVTAGEQSWLYIPPPIHMLSFPLNVQLISVGDDWPRGMDRNGIVDMFDFALITQDWLLETSWYEP